MFIDSHCHIHKREFKDKQDLVFANMDKNKVSHALCVTISLEDFPDAWKLAQAHENVHCSVGIHPGPAPGKVRETTEKELIELSAKPKVVAIGETGLDYYRVEPRQKWQMNRFRTHIRAARACGKPLIIHTRQAADDTIAILREEKAGVGDGGPGGVMHCFSETNEIARAALDLGFYISFSGVLTYPANKALRSIARLIPLDRLLIETDSPWLNPQSVRGKGVNEPANVVEVAKTLAMTKGMSPAKLADITRANYFRLFGIEQ